MTKQEADILVGAVGVLRKLRDDLSLQACKPGGDAQQFARVSVRAEVAAEGLTSYLICAEVWGKDVEAAAAMERVNA